MALFEFVMVLVSIIVGLGIATLLTGVADVLRAGDTVKPYWIHSLTVVMVFLAHAQVWWETWDLNAAPQWSFGGLLMMLGAPICLFLISHLLFPETLTGVDLSEYYFQVARVIWPLGAMTTLVGTLFRPVAFGSSVLHVANLASIPMVIVCLILASTRDRRVHTVLVPAILILIWLDTILITGVQG
jgi:hypothetical protein